MQTGHGPPGQKRTEDLLPLPLVVRRVGASTGPAVIRMTARTEPLAVMSGHAEHTRGPSDVHGAAAVARDTATETLRAPDWQRALPATS